MFTSLFPMILTLALLGPWAAGESAIPHDGQLDDAPTANDAVAEQPVATTPERSAVDALLDDLEKAAEGLRDFEARIAYHKLDAALDRREIRAGRIVYQVREDGTKRFAVLFDTVTIGRSQRDVKKHYVFDGSWLAEIDHEQKMFIKRQVVEPGKRMDPLKLGEGPFPLPIGQPRAEVLARFDVSEASVPDEIPLKLLDKAKVRGIRLVPKPGTPEAEEYTSVDVFYDTETLLPVGVDALAARDAVEGYEGKDRKFVLMTQLKKNEGVDDAMLTVEEPDPREWRISVTPWNG